MESGTRKRDQGSRREIKRVKISILLILLRKVTKGVQKHGSEPHPIVIFPLFAVGLDPADDEKI